MSECDVTTSQGNGTQWAISGSTVTAASATAVAAAAITATGTAPTPTTAPSSVNGSASAMSSEDKDKAVAPSSTSPIQTTTASSTASKVTSPGQSPDQGKDSGSNGDRSIAGDADQDSSASSQSTADKKGKKVLVRSEAVRDESSPPPPAKEANVEINSSYLSVQNPPHSHKGNPLKNQGSGSTEGSFSSLSRDSSTENYTDSTGIDLEKFIKDTLQNNPKDRILLLKLEQEFINLINDPKREIHKFERMTSYHRMYVHRVAAFFGLDHNIDPSGTSVIVQKTRSTRIPDFKFSDYGSSTELTLDEPKKSILKRDSSSFDDTSGISMGSGSKDKSPDRYAYGGSGSLGDSMRSKSLEEREEEYMKTKARIFGGHEGGPGFGRSKSEDQAPGHRYSESKSHLRGPGQKPYRSTSFQFSGHSHYQQRKQQSYHVPSEAHSQHQHQLASQFGALSIAGPSSVGAPSAAILTCPTAGQAGLGPMDLKDVSQAAAMAGYGVSVSPFGYGIGSSRGMAPVNAIPLPPTAIPISQMPLCYYPAPQPPPPPSSYPPGMMLPQHQVMVASPALPPPQRAPYASGSPSNKQGYGAPSPHNTPPPPPGQNVSTSASYTTGNMLPAGSVISTHPHSPMAIGYATTGGAPCPSSSSCQSVDPSNAPQNQPHQQSQYMQGGAPSSMQIYHPHQQHTPYSYVSSQPLNTVTSTAHMGHPHPSHLNGMGSSGGNGGGSGHASHLVHMGQISPVNQYAASSNQYNPASNQQSYHAMMSSQTHGGSQQQHRSLDSPSHSYSSTMGAGQTASSQDQSYSSGSAPSSSSSSGATIVGYGVVPGTHVLQGVVIAPTHQMQIGGRQGTTGQPMAGLQMSTVPQGLGMGDMSQGGAQSNGVSLGQQQQQTATSMGSPPVSGGGGSMTPNRMVQAQQMISSSGLPVGMALGQASQGAMAAAPLLPSPGTQYHTQGYTTHPPAHQASLSGDSPYITHCGYYNPATGQITLEPTVQSPPQQQQQQVPQAQQQVPSSSTMNVAQGSVSCPDNRYYNPMPSVGSPATGTPSKTPRGKLQRSKKSK